MSQDVNFAASGFGEQSRFYDDDLLMDGTYQIISVTIDSTSRDDGNSADTTKLRKGLLLAPTTGYSDKYFPVSTVDGFINGTPTQYMKDVVVLAREEHMIYAYIMGNKRRRIVDAEDRVVPAYIKCNIKSGKVYYNNSSNLAITTAQWNKCQRINRIPSGMAIYDRTETLVRALLWNRKETTITKRDFS